MWFMDNHPIGNEERSFLHCKMLARQNKKQQQNLIDINYKINLIEA